MTVVFRDGLTHSVPVDVAGRGLLLRDDSILCHQLATALIPEVELFGKVATVFSVDSSLDVVLLYSTLEVGRV